MGTTVPSLGHRRSGLRSRFSAFSTRCSTGAWTRADAKAYANIMEAKQRLGDPLDDHLPDAMIAATAGTRRLTVLTRNESEFRNTGVAWVNPLDGAGPANR